MSKPQRDKEEFKLAAVSLVLDRYSTESWAGQV